MQLTWTDAHPQQPELTLEHLRRCGVSYERVALDGPTLQPRLEALKLAGGYLEQDVVELSPVTPALDEICASFAREHSHADDEVRFVLEGAGVFDIRDDKDHWMRIQVEAGDLIVVPKLRHHRFYLTESKQIRCVRLFKDSAGWVPHYR